MEKKAYRTPNMEVVSVGSEGLMIQGSVKSVSSNVFSNTTITGGNGGARSHRRRNAWTNDWDD